MEYRVDVSETGLAGQRRTIKKGYDVVLMDLEMPDMVGFEADRTIRKPNSSVLNRDIPIITMNSHTVAKDKDRCLDAGMNGYISKPFEFEELKSEIK